ncbi:MAG: hypothetical protein OEW87_03325 [Flavobacteriaceae bacterium]|nr:hypothetical protein [Flavobacteriaceae bacterium]
MGLTIDIIRNSVRYTELISAVVGSIYFYKYRHTVLKYFLILLWYITITEFCGYYFRKYKFLVHISNDGVVYNLWLYNLLEIVTFGILYYIFFKSLKTTIYKLWTKILAIGFVLLTIVNWGFLQNFILEWSEFPNIYGSLTLIIIILFYFIELLRSDKIILFHRNLLFWISVGLLLFYAGTLPFAIKVNGYALIPGIHGLFLIIYILAIFMYLTFTFGFIWSKKV